MPIEYNFAPPYAVPAENICFLIKKSKSVRQVDEITIVSLMKEETHHFELAKKVFIKTGSFDFPNQTTYAKYLQNAAVLTKDGRTQIIPALQKWIKNPDETIWREAGFSHWHRGFKSPGPTDLVTGLTRESRTEFGTTLKEKGKWYRGHWIDPVKDIQMKIEQDYYGMKSQVCIYGYESPFDTSAENITTSLLKNNLLSEARHRYDHKLIVQKFADDTLFLSKIQLSTDPDAPKGINDMGGIPALLNFTPTYPRWRKTEPTLPQLLKLEQVYT